MGKRGREGTYDVKSSTNVHGGGTACSVVSVYYAERRSQCAVCNSSFKVPRRKIDNSCASSLASGTSCKLLVSLRNGPGVYGRSNLSLGLRNRCMSGLDLIDVVRETFRTCNERSKGLVNGKTFADGCVNEVEEVGILIDGEPIER